MNQIGTPLPALSPQSAERVAAGRERGGSWRAQLTDHLQHCLPVNLKGAFAKTDEQYLLNRALPFENIFDFRYRNPRRAFHRKSVSPGADGRECNRAHVVLFRERQRVSITTREQFVLAMFSVAPDGADRVNDPFGRERSEEHTSEIQS